MENNRQVDNSTNLIWGILLMLLAFWLHLMCRWIAFSQSIPYDKEVPVAIQYSLLLGLASLLIVVACRCFVSAAKYITPEASQSRLATARFCAVLAAIIGILQGWLVLQGGNMAISGFHLPLTYLPGLTVTTLCGLSFPLVVFYLPRNPRTTGGVLITIALICMCLIDVISGLPGVLFVVAGVSAITSTKNLRTSRQF